MDTSYPELSGSESESEDELSGSASASTSGTLSTASSLGGPLGSSLGGPVGGVAPAVAALLHGRLAEAAPPVASLAARSVIDPLTLRFADHKLERQFQVWRNSRLAKVGAVCGSWRGEGAGERAAEMGLQGGPHT